MRDQGGNQVIPMDPILLLDEHIQSATYRVKEGEHLSLRCASFKLAKDCKIEVFVENNASFEGVFADFSNSSFHANVTVYLQGEGSSASLRTACLSKGDNRKTYDVSIVHQAPHTDGLVDCYGICEGKSRLIFTGVSKIDNGAYESNTRQSAKIIVFDPECLGRCSPILKIDENNVKASHAAVVGKLNDDHLFYLLSRGLDMAQARKLITQGYLMPIASYFDEAEKARIMEAIESEL